MKKLYFFGPRRAIEFKTIGEGVWMRSLNETLTSLESAMKFCEVFDFILVRRDK